MTDNRLVVISDIHLSAERPFFFHNWDIVAEWICREAPDMVLCCGDVALNGPANPSDLSFARRQLDRLPVPVHVVPGNHDVGNNLPDVRGEHVFTDALREAYCATMGPDRFAVTLGAFAFVGINGLMAGSGGAAEAEQLAWLEETLAAHQGREIVLVMHKPLFLKSPEESTLHQGSLYPEPRAVLSAILARHGVRRVLSGHNHEFLHDIRSGIEFIWAPSTAFVVDGGRPARGDGLRKPGFLDVRLSGGNMDVKFVTLDDLVTTDIAGWLSDGIRLYEHHTTAEFRRP